MTLNERFGGVSEIADLLGTEKTNVNRWIERRSSTNFPMPILSLTMGNIYYLPSVEDWYAAWRRTRG